MRVPLILGLTFAFLLTTPLAAADHSFSHRYAVYGWVVDAEGDPVANAAVAMRFEGDSAEGPCSTPPGSDTEAWGPMRTSPVTNAQGEFQFCFHLHTLSRQSPGTAVIRVEGTDVETRFTLDPHLRRSIVVVELPGSDAGDSAGKAGFYTVHARAFQPSSEPIRVEAIVTYGDTIRQTPVVVMVGGLAPVETMTNQYGDFAVRVPIGEGELAGDVVVTIEDQTFRSPVDARLGFTAIDAVFPVQDEPDAPPVEPTPLEPEPARDGVPTQDASDPNGDATETPGALDQSHATIPMPPLLVLLAALLALAYRSTWR